MKPELNSGATRRVIQRFLANYRISKSCLPPFVGKPIFNCDGRRVKMKQISCVGLLAAGLLLLQGCATGSGVSYEPVPGQKVGVLNMVEATY